MAAMGSPYRTTASVGDAEVMAASVATTVVAVVAATSLGSAPRLDMMIVD